MHEKKYETTSQETSYRFRKAIQRKHYSIRTEERDVARITHEIILGLYYLLMLRICYLVMPESINRASINALDSR